MNGGSESATCSSGCRKVLVADGCVGSRAVSVVAEGAQLWVPGKAVRFGSEGHLRRLRSIRSIDERQACRQPPTSPSFHSDRAHSRGWVNSRCAKRFTPLHPSVDDAVVILERTAGDGS